MYCRRLPCQSLHEPCRILSGGPVYHSDSLWIPTQKGGHAEHAGSDSDEHNAWTRLLWQHRCTRQTRACRLLPHPESLMFCRSEHPLDPYPSSGFFIQFLACALIHDLRLPDCNGQGWRLAKLLVANLDGVAWRAGYIQRATILAAAQSSLLAVTDDSCGAQAKRNLQVNLPQIIHRLCESGMESLHPIRLSVRAYALSCNSVARNQPNHPAHVEPLLKSSNLNLKVQGKPEDLTRPGTSPSPDGFCRCHLVRDTSLDDQVCLRKIPHLGAGFDLALGPLQCSLILVDAHLL
jgi:hypothetical protein